MLLDNIYKWHLDSFSKIEFIINNFDIVVLKILYSAVVIISRFNPRFWQVTKPSPIHKKNWKKTDHILYIYRNSVLYPVICSSPQVKFKWLQNKTYTKGVSNISNLYIVELIRLFVSRCQLGFHVSESRDNDEN